MVCANGTGDPGPARELEGAGYSNPSGGLIGRGLKGAVYPKPSDKLEEAAGIAGAAEACATLEKLGYPNLSDGLMGAAGACPNTSEGLVGEAEACPKPKGGLLGAVGALVRVGLPNASGGLVIGAAEVFLVRGRRGVLQKDWAGEHFGALRSRARLWIRILWLP